MERRPTRSRTKSSCAWRRARTCLCTLPSAGRWSRRGRRRTICRRSTAAPAVMCLSAQVAELVPKRPVLPRVGCGAEKAVEDFEAQVFAVAMTLLDEYRKVYGIAENGDPDEVWRSLGVHLVTAAGPPKDSVRAQCQRQVLCVQGATQTLRDQGQDAVRLRCRPATTGGAREVP